MKLYLTIIWILIFGSIAFGQPPSMKSQQPESARPLWQRFTPLEEDFSLDAPAAPLTGSINTAAAQTTTNRSYSTSANGVYYFIFSDSSKYPDQNKTAFDFAGAMADRNSENVVFKFKDGTGFYHRILTVRHQSRVYTFQTVAETENNPDPDRFFAGIKFSGKPLELKEIVSNAAPKPDPEIVPLPEKSENRNGGTGSGSGIGTGSGTRSGNGIGTGTEASKAPTSPLKILAKPRPPYTDYARFYNISGVVRLRVTFLANGTIGSVSPVTKLPFGLTEQAAAAAKQITFDPLISDGKPQNVVRLIEYNFYIY